MSDDSPRVATSQRDRVLVIALDRASKKNAFDLRMLRELAAALTRYEDDPGLWCAVLCAEGDSFTAGLDLAEVGPHVAAGNPLFPEDDVDPLGLFGRERTKPLVMAVQGHCLTIGIELMLAADIGVASDDTRFGQIEINRGIFPFGGATVRLPELAGWSNAMRWLLTGDRFDAAEAQRIGLVQEVVPAGEQRERAVSIAETVAKRAPLGVRATLASARTAQREGFRAAVDGLVPQARELMDSEDAQEGLQSFVERREARFSGK